jgi:hypothetical protein
VEVVMPDGSDNPDGPGSASSPTDEQVGNTTPSTAGDFLSYDPLSKTNAYTGTPADTDTAIAQVGETIGWIDAAGTWFGAALGALSPATIGLLILAGIAAIGGVYYRYRLYTAHVRSQEALSAGAELAQNGLSDENRMDANTAANAIREAGKGTNTKTPTGGPANPGATPPPCALSRNDYANWRGLDGELSPSCMGRQREIHSKYDPLILQLACVMEATESQADALIDPARVKSLQAAQDACVDACPKIKNYFGEGPEPGCSGRCVANSALEANNKAWQELWKKIYELSGKLKLQQHQLVSEIFANRANCR